MKLRSLQGAADGIRSAPRWLVTWLYELLYERAPPPVPEGVHEDPSVYGLLEWAGAPALRKMVHKSISETNLKDAATTLDPDQLTFYAQPPGAAEYGCLWCCRTGQWVRKTHQGLIHRPGSHSRKGKVWCVWTAKWLPTVGTKGRQGAGVGGDGGGGGGGGGGVSNSKSASGNSGRGSSSKSRRSSSSSSSRSNKRSKTSSKSSRSKQAKLTRARCVLMINFVHTYIQYGCTTVVVSILYLLIKLLIFFVS